jgi:hypothetical protein
VYGSVDMNQFRTENSSNVVGDFGFWTLLEKNVCVSTQDLKGRWKAYESLDVFSEIFALVCQKKLKFCPLARALASEQDEKEERNPQKSSFLMANRILKSAITSHIENSERSDLECATVKTS